METPGNISIGLLGIVAANGLNGIQNCNGGGAGGGGGGGELWFDAGNSFINEGNIDAIGGAGINGQCVGGATTSSPGSSGAGSGGVVLIDPLSIENDGTIDVADGNGLGTYGGLVDTFGEVITGDGQITGEGAVPEPATAALLLSAWERWSLFVGGGQDDKSARDEYGRVGVGVASAHRGYAPSAP